ncbi:MAG: hypothetical protein JXR83_22155 [Deltaproteobacteria bacterium]|nr:hypothetical protein [Deltaproteobacteria bacterium]
MKKRHGSDQIARHGRLLALCAMAALALGCGVKAPPRPPTPATVSR